MKVIFTRTRYKYKGCPDVLSEVVELPDDCTADQIRERLEKWSDDKGHGDYEFDFVGGKYNGAKIK